MSYYLRYVRLAVACLVITLLSALPINAQEAIKDFDVSMSVHPNGRVDIEERIRVTVENIQIKHGIYRDIPTIYTDRFGNRVNIRFSLNDIKRNGQTEPYHIQQMPNGIRIYIGHKSALVPWGEYTYTINYSVSRVIGFFENYDELYWNITGNGWDFPIDHAKVQIDFPEQAVVQNVAGYTGPQGAQGTNYRAAPHANYIVAETTRSLNPHEGFTLAASIPKSIIHPETGFQKQIAFLTDNRAWAACIISSFALFFFLFFAWFRWGRDVPDTIFPRFELLRGLRPDFLRYVYRQDYDIGTFTTFFIDAAVKGYITISETESSIQISFKNGVDSRSSNDSTIQILRSIFGGSGGILLPKKSLFGVYTLSEDKRKEIAEALQRGKLAHMNYLGGFGKSYFYKNWGIKMVGAAIVALGLFLGYSLSWNDDQQIAVLITTGIIHGCIFYIFNKPLNKYTDHGQRLRDYADGLKLYLTTAEQARLNKLYPKTVTPEQFEAFLPYAFALGVEQKWCQRFASLVRSGHATYNQDGSPSWYHNTHHGRLSLSALGSSLGSNLQGTISSASTPPGSKSGALGGGSSGGGGGGGGGGGW